MHRKLTVAAVAGVFLAAPAAAVAGHGLELLDHPSVGIAPQSPPSSAFVSGGRGAKWEPIATFPTGNPHTDLDFFTQKGNIYASVGTLGIGPNAGGQEIFQLTNGNTVAPKAVKAYPSASCISDPSQATGLQHDVEAAPKGKSILNADVLQADRRDTQILLDATDAPGRCHDQGAFGVVAPPQGGLEIIDVTDVSNPVVIGMTSHIGEAHTVNVDPRRPHIAYAVTSDGTGVNAAGRRTNEIPTSGASTKLNLDGFEVVDLSSCMNFPAGTTIAAKRAKCRPQVYRYRYPNTLMSHGHTNKGTIFGCHELEVYPSDRLTCASGQAMMHLDLAGAFDDRGTRSNFRDDKPRGTPLKCSLRESSSVPPFTTDAMITDCVDGQGAGTDDLDVAKWLAAGAPSLTGVKWLGSAFHMGRESAQGAANPAFNSTQDIDFDHEAELTHSGRYAIATDERGGGIVPPGASCSPTTDLTIGNGGLHAYRVDKLLNRRPTSPTDAFTSYAKNSKGGKAIFRAQVRTKPQAALCTAHVFQQIPGQNRIFMGWYAQGTQVVDFEENANGTIDFKEAGYMIPENANQWVSHIFKVQRNSNGSFTYYGAAADFYVGDGGRGTVEVYKATLPAPPKPRGSQFGLGEGFAPSTCLARRARFGRKNIGRLRLGQSRARTARRARPLGNISKRTRVFRFCVRGDGKARGIAAFNKKGNRRLRLAATTAKRHKIGGLGRGNKTSRVRRRYSGRVRAIGKGRLRVRTKSGAVIFGSRKGKVTYVALVDRAVAKSLRKTRAYLKLAKLR